MHNYPNIKNIEFNVLDELQMSKPLIIAGPCAIENYEDMAEYAELLLSLGINYIRGGIYKPRTSPHDFQGLGDKGIEVIKKLKANYPIKVITEVTDASQLPLLIDTVDVIQIGARNMQNFELLKKVGETNLPILLKRGFGSTIDEWLGAAEYIMQTGNKKVILCERGIKTFEPLLRNTLDLAGAILTKEISKLPVIIDPSHATGNASLVPSLAKAGIVAGCDGIMVEIHKDPSKALCDAEQALNLDEFKKLVEDIKNL